MIILITGATHTGKTLLAQKLLETYKFPYLSMDHVKMGLIRTGITSLTPLDDAQMTAFLWPVIREIIKTNVENRQSLIVEGCYVPAGWEREFPPEYLREIRFLCLAMTDRYIRAHFAEITAHASDIESRIADGDFTLDTALGSNAEYRALFGKTPGFVPIDGDYENVLRKIVADMAPQQADGRQSGFRVIPYEDRYRDDMIFTVLSAKNALGRVPRLNPDLMNVKESYFEKGDCFWLALDAADRVVGCVGYSSIPDSTEVFLHRLFVKPELKRKGIGSLLLQTAEAHIRLQGKTAIRVHLGEPRETWYESYAFYPKHGYEEYAPRYMKKGL